MKDYIIRNMTEKEVSGIAASWAAAEGWNPGLNDASVFYGTDPNGFFVGELEGIPVSCISTVSYGGEFGFLGFYIVKPEFRGKGFGIEIWKHGMEYLKGHNIGLDGVVAQQANYAKSGFKFAYSNIRFEFTAGEVKNTKENIVEYSDDWFENAARYDREMFPADRRVFLKKWFNMPGSLTYLSLEGGKIAGLVTIRKCLSGFKLGPLYADSVSIAEDLLAAASRYAGKGETLYLDVPEVNGEALALAGKYGMKKVFETARMYTGQEPDINLKKLFGVTTFELG